MKAIIQYTVRRDALDEHLDLLHMVYAELREQSPLGLRWSTFQVGDDPQAFLEIVEGPDLPGPLPDLASFQRYRVGLDDRCDGSRTFTELQEIASFGRP